jgi:hypothetical protein
MNVRADAQVADGGCAHQILRSVAGTAVRIDNDRSRARKVFEQPRSHRLHDLAYGLAIIVSRQTDENIHLANVDQFANEIVGKYAPVRQKELLAFQL